MAKTQNPQPQPSQRWINADGTPSLAFFQYMSQRETLSINNQVGPLVSAATDALAAVAGVPVGGLYSNAGTVKIRLK